jgi:hypothetical protein
MSQWTGTLRYVDVGPGTWVLDTEEGTLQLSGSVPANLAGTMVEVEGRPINAFGFGMVSDRSIEVRRVARHRE